MFNLNVAHGLDDRSLAEFDGEPAAELCEINGSRHGIRRGMHLAVGSPVGRHDGEDDAAGGCGDGQDAEWLVASELGAQLPVHGVAVLVVVLDVHGGFQYHGDLGG